MRSDDIEQLRRLELASMVEATTLLLLVAVATPLKHLAGLPGFARIMGPAHGLAFLFYLWTVVQTVAAGRWTRGEIARLALVAFIPFAGFLNGTWLRRREHKIKQGRAA